MKKIASNVKNMAYRVNMQYMNLKVNGLKKTIEDAEGSVIENVIIWGLVAAAAIAIGIAVMNAVKGRSDDMVNKIKNYEYIE